MAIRRPHKPAEEFDANELFATDTRGTGNPPPIYSSGFVVDTQISVSNINGAASRFVFDRLRSNKFFLRTDDTGLEESGGGGLYRFDQMEGIGVGSVAASTADQMWMWRRAPGFFDVVTYRGQSTQLTVYHTLRVAPEMIWIKNRSDSADWWHVGSTYLSNTSGWNKYLILNDNNTEATIGYWENYTPNSSNFRVSGGTGPVNDVGKKYIAYLFASVPGICDIGSYTGTASTLNIDCGFATGARFVLIKRIDVTAGWYFWDTLRGISSGNDPFLDLNSTAQQTTSLNVLNPLSSGFTVTGNPTINANGGKYIYMAIA
jgi:hypothetical protein